MFKIVMTAPVGIFIAQSDFGIILNQYNADKFCNDLYRSTMTCFIVVYFRKCYILMVVWYIKNDKYLPDTNLNDRQSVLTVWNYC